MPGQLRHFIGTVVGSFRAEQAFVPYTWFTQQEASALWFHRSAGQAPRIDEHTWADLEVDSFLEKTLGGFSIAARQLATAIILGSSDGARSVRASLVDTGASALQQERWRHTLELLRAIDIDLASALFGGKSSSLPEWSRFVWLLPLLSCPLILLAFGAGPGLGFLSLALYFVPWALVQIKLAPSLRQWKRTRIAIASIARVAEDFAESPSGAPPCFDELHAQAKSIHALRRIAVPSLWERVPGLADYMNLFALAEYQSALSKMRAFAQLRNRVGEVYLAVAACELSIALCSERSKGGTCLASSAGPRELHFSELRHPLLQRSHPLSLDLSHRSAFITGRNASGKSTLLRALGLNVLIGSAFGYCYARSARFGATSVISSIRNQDSLADGVSLYMAELDRASAILQVVSRSGNALVVFDEIFRGTNNLESVAAAAALLRAAALRGVVLTTSHNAILSELLQPQFECFVVTTTHAGVTQLDEGVIEDTNGLDLMEDYPFPRDVLEEARRAHADLSRRLHAPAGMGLERA